MNDLLWFLTVLVALLLVAAAGAAWRNVARHYDQAPGDGQ